MRKLTLEQALKTPNVYFWITKKQAEELAIIKNYLELVDCELVVLVNDDRELYIQNRDDFYLISRQITAEQVQIVDYSEFSNKEEMLEYLFKSPDHCLINSITGEKISFQNDYTIAAMINIIKNDSFKNITEWQVHTEKDMEWGNVATTSYFLCCLSDPVAMNLKTPLVALAKCIGQNKFMTSEGNVYRNSILLTKQESNHFIFSESPWRN